MSSIKLLNFLKWYDLARSCGKLLLTASHNRLPYFYVCTLHDKSLKAHYHMRYLLTPCTDFDQVKFIQ